MENNNSENENLIWVAPRIITVKPEKTESGTSGLYVSEGNHNSNTVFYAS